MAKKKIKNVASGKAVSNGLAEALLAPGFGPTGIGTQLNQVDTLFKNNRWYMVSNMRQVLSESYVEHGLIQTIVDVPVDDGLRGGVEIKTKQLDERQIQDLKASIDRDGDLLIVGQAMKWNRLFGGAGVIILTDQDPTTPLDIEAIDENSRLKFRAVDMWELFWDKQNTEGYSAELQMEQSEFYSYYSTKLHHSRVFKIKGMEAPSFVRPRLRGWGFSVVEALINSINQYLKSNNLTFEVLDEFKVDYYKIKNLTNTLMGSDGTAIVQRRVQIANMQKNFQNAVTMDSEDDFQQKQISFAGLAEAQAGIRMQVASDMRMPLTKLFGISAAGFNSGEDDIENYNGMVTGQVRDKCKHHILRMIELKCKKMFGIIPDDLEVEFEPLRILSAEQEENVKTSKFNRLLAARQAGEISTKEFKDACNRDNLLSIQLDTSLDDVDVDTATGPNPGEDAEKKKAPVDKPQAAAKEAAPAKETPEAKS